MPRTRQGRAREPNNRHTVVDLTESEDEEDVVTAGSGVPDQDTEVGDQERIPRRSQRLRTLQNTRGPVLRRNNPRASRLRRPGSRSLLLKATNNGRIADHQVSETRIQDTSGGPERAPSPTHVLLTRLREMQRIQEGGQTSHHDLSREPSPDGDSATLEHPHSPPQSRIPSQESPYSPPHTPLLVQVQEPLPSPFSSLPSADTTAQDVTRGSACTPRVASSVGEPRIFCLVCLDSLKNIQLSSRVLCSTMCGHVYCSACIDKVMMLQRRCPVCQVRLYQKSYHPLFL